MENSVTVGEGDIPGMVKSLLRRKPSTVPPVRPISDSKRFPFPWTVLGVELCSDQKAVRKMKRDLAKGQITTEEALTQILKGWIDGYAEQGSGAPLEELLQKMISNHLNGWADETLSLLLKLSREAVEKKVELKTVHQDESTANDASITYSSQEQALYNTLIVEEIFKHLPFEDRKNFKLVNQGVGELIRRLWRSSARIRIGDFDFAFDNNRYYRIRVHLPSFRRLIDMEEYVELCKQKKGPGHSAQDKTLELLAYPYRSYSIVNIRSHAGEIEENEFWKTCGPLIENLKLPRFYQRNNEAIVKAVTKLLLSLCPNLKELEIRCIPEWDDSDSASETTITMAEKLETLIFNLNVHEEDIYDDTEMSPTSTSKILKICPNLKSLVVGTGRNIEGLLQPATNGKFIKLESLVISAGDRAGPDGYSSFQSLPRYVEKFPDTLKHLTIKRLNDTDITSNSSNLCSALGKCSHNLQSLELKFDEDTFIGKIDWLTDLSRFSFPNLTKFRLANNERYSKNPFRYDFGTLKVMPKLKELDVNLGYRDLIKFPRSSGAEDWISVAPPGGADQLAPAAGSEKKLILSTTLKKFCFHGWEINPEDVKLLSQWFPNLTSLDGRLSTESLPLLLESWERLERLQVRSKGFFSLSKLGLLKETKKSLKIVTQLMEELGWISADGRQCQYIEVKELNGHVYFDKCSQEGIPIYRC